MKLVIMAGGAGSKLWPLSRESYPKQFIPLIKGKSLFQLNLEGLLEKYSPEDIFVSIPEVYVHFVEEQAAMISKQNYILEPNLLKGSGPSSAYAMLKVAKKYPDEVIMFYVQPVVIREPNFKYLEMIDVIEKLVQKYGMLVTGGMEPDYIDNGSDHLKLGESLGEEWGMGVHKVSRFVDVVNEKYTVERLEDEMSKDTLLLHCNHYAWKKDAMMTAVKEIRPDWYITLEKIDAVIGTENEKEEVFNYYKEFEPGRFESISKPLCNTGKVIVVTLPFNWAHITIFNNLYEYSRRNENLMLDHGDIIELESTGNLILSPRTKTVAVVGIDNCVVVDTPDVLLVTTRDKTGKIADLIDMIKKDPNKKHLL